MDDLVIGTGAQGPGDGAGLQPGDPVSGESLELGAPIALEGFSGRWLRFAKS